MTEKQLIDAIKDILLIQEEVTPGYKIKVDSLASLLLIQFFDENFGFRLTSEKLNQIQKIDDLINLVKEKLV